MLDPTLPVVAICNISETFYDFLNRAPDDEARARLVHGEQYRGDRAMLWLGAKKLVFTTFPIPHARYLQTEVGYAGSTALAPSRPSPWLSLDILREPPLLSRLVDYAGPRRTLQIVPYATTPHFLRLVEILRVDHGLTVLLPESPLPESQWVRDCVDTKAGFRQLVSRWVAPALLPEGIACTDLGQAGAVAHWFSTQGRACLVKADDGENGIGNRIVTPGRYSSAEAITAVLRADPFLRHGGVTVEAFIQSTAMLSPSVELLVPPLGSGAPLVAHVASQLFLDEYGDFCGVTLSRDDAAAPWYEPLVTSGLTIGRQLQAMGYVGHFDLDAIVDDAGGLFLVEINSRRTGSTHVHEFATFAFGPNYLDEVALLSHDAMGSGAIREPAALFEAVAELRYPMRGMQMGVLITVTSALAAGEFGCIIVAPSLDEAAAMQQVLRERIQGWASRPAG